jgi:putative ABC transport system permease protein
MSREDFPFLLRLANGALRLFLPSDDYEGISGDLREEYEASSQSTLWYWAQTIRAIALGTGGRLRTIREGCSTGWGKDIQQSIRRIVRTPGFSVVVVLTLALGIGANTAIFSFVEALLLRSLPFAEPDRLVQVHTFNGSERSRLSLREVADLNEQAKLFDGFAAYRDSAYNYGGDGGPAEHLLIARTTENLFQVLGVPLALGETWPKVNDRSRSFTIVLSYELWKRRFHSDPAIVGKQVLMDGFPNTVAGVASPGFSFPAHAMLFRCWGIDRDPNAYEARERRLALVVGRLKPGVSIRRARAELSSIAQRLARDFPATNRQIQFDIAPLQDTYAGAVRPYLMLLLGAVGFVLLMACVNVANLFLTRSASRQREMSIRAALGASRVRLIRQFMVESLIYSLVAGFMGFLIAYLAVGVISRIITVDLPPWMEVRIDNGVLLFLFGVSLLTGLLAGAIPAWRASRRDLSRTLSEGSRGSSKDSRVLQPLVAVEIAFAVVLLAGAGLMVQSFLRLLKVDLGFRPDHLLTFDMGLSWRKYNLDRARQFEQQVLSGLSGLPGVRAAIGSTSLPLTGRESTVPITVDGQTSERDQSRNPLVNFQQVSANYHQAMGIPLFEGRHFSDFDREGSQSVAIVSAHLAKRLWPGQSPLGKRILPADVLAPWVPKWLTVVGVVGDVKHESPASEPGLDLYIPFTQAGTQHTSFAIRTTVDPQTLATAALQIVASVDREEPASEMMTMHQVVENTIWQRRLTGVVFAVLGGLALLLATIGTYGVIAYSVSQRIKEIGIRSALGARPPDILRMVAVDGARFIFPGVLAGLGIALLLGRLVSNLLFEIGASDAVTLGGVVGVLATVSAFACLVPAWRAANLDPLRALRDE